jgi:hypothetical protein
MPLRSPCVPAALAALNHVGGGHVECSSLGAQLDNPSAEPRFNFANDAWLFPPTGSQYRCGIRHLRANLERLESDSDKTTHFYTRADNLNELFADIEKRLGSLSQRLNASIGKVRVNSRSRGRAIGRANNGLGAARRSPDTLDANRRCFLRGLRLRLGAAAHSSGRGDRFSRSSGGRERGSESPGSDSTARADAGGTLEPRRTERRPPRLGRQLLLGWVANYSKAMVSYISPAHAAIIDLRTPCQVIGGVG